MPSDKQALFRLRRICRRLPETVEQVSWGHPNFKVAKKTFAAFEQYKGEWAVCFRAESDQQAFLVETDQRFYVSPYGGRYGWVSARVGPRMNWRQLERLVIESYRLVAPPKLDGVSNKRDRSSARVQAVRRRSGRRTR